MRKGRVWFCGDSQAHAWIEPSLAFGYEKSFSNSTSLHTYARFSVLSFLTKGRTDVLADFAGAPAGADPMRVSSDLDRTHYLGELGFEVIARRFTFSLSYSAESSDIRDSSMGTVRVVFPIH